MRTIERVKRKTLYNKREDGGLCMTNLECFQNSFLLGWVERLLNSEYEDWKAVAIEALKMVGGRSVFKSNVKSKHFKGLHLVKNSFWKKVVCVWLDNNKFSSRDPEVKFPPQTPLFNNNDIRFKNATLFFPRCIMNNIVYVDDMTVNNTLISYDQFKRLLNVPNSLLIYNCIYNALILKLHLIGSLNIANVVEEPKTHFREISLSQIHQTVRLSHLFWSRSDG